VHVVGFKNIGRKKMHGMNNMQQTTLYLQHYLCIALLS